MKSNPLFASALPLVFVVVPLAVLGITKNVFSPSPIVIAAQVAAVGLNVWARISFKNGTFRISAAPGGKSVIRSGPYRVIRHPMYAAVLLFVWASVAGHPSVLTLVIGGAVSAVCIVRVMVEESLLREELPEYAAYSRETKALIPFLF